jgi:hypothetical protein
MYANVAEEYENPKGEDAKMSQNRAGKSIAGDAVLSKNVYWPLDRASGDQGSGVSLTSLKSSAGRKLFCRWMGAPGLAHQSGAEQGHQDLRLRRKRATLKARPGCVRASRSCTKVPPWKRPARSPTISRDVLAETLRSHIYACCCR